MGESPAGRPLPPPSAAALAGEWCMPSSLDHIAPVRHWVGQHAQQAGVDARVVREIQVALSEALSNVILHAYEGLDGAIRVGVAVEQGRLVIRIQDWGAPFPQEAWNAPAPSEPRTGGYGLMLMRLYTDEIACTRAGDESNLMVLARALDSQPRRPPASD